MKTIDESTGWLWLRIALACAGLIALGVGVRFGWVLGSAYFALR
jgi:hypothetical protein